MTARNQFISAESFTLIHILEEQSRDLYDAQTSFSNFLDGVGGAINSTELAGQVKDLASDTCKNIADLQAVCDLLEVPCDGVRCAAMDGLLREAKATTQEYANSAVKDAALIANVQRISHYEIAGFGTAKAFAVQLNLTMVANLFDEMLDRASDNDKALTKIAEGSWFSSGINSLAAKGE